MPRCQSARAGCQGAARWREEAASALALWHSALAPWHSGTLTSIDCAKPVDGRWKRCATGRKIELFSRQRRTKHGRCTVLMRLRFSFRLNAFVQSLESVGRSDISKSAIDERTATNVHRFEEVINGREYLIEVSSVGLGKWRAQIARVPGGSAALMPFYGKTPDEAARHLSRWLALAHGQAQPRV